MTGLPTPPPGAWWEVHGTPTAPWLWSSEIVWHYDGHPFAGRTTGHYLTSATAGEAHATLRW